MGGTTTWRGVTLDQRTADMMTEVCRLRPDLPIWGSQGSYSGGVEASAGTHSGGGAIDLAGEDLSPNQRTALETTMRQVGFAAWVRGPDHGFSWHVHGIAVACPDLSPPAADQVDDYNAGRNGLADNGPDTGTRTYVGVTWETYKQEEDPLMAGHLATFFNHKGSIYEADLAAGTYWRIKDSGTLNDRKSMLTRAGVPWFDWDPGNDVANPDAFGRLIN